MSLKDNIDAVKKELSTEEQFLESVIKAEGFWKKYKKIVISLAVTAVVASLAYVMYNNIQQSNLNASNEAFLALEKNPNDSSALEILKSKNPNLYQLFIFSSEVKTDDPSKLDSLASKVSDPILKDLISYQKDSLAGKDLKSYSMRQEALLKEFATLEEVYLLFKSGKSDEARKLLDQIPNSSNLHQIAQSFKHYLK